MQKRHKEDWLAAGLELLAGGGAPKLTVHALSARLKMTKGSFYHHFGSLDGYIAALMQHWLEERSLAFIRLAERRRHAGRAALLAALAAEAGGDAERAVRAWGAHSPLVRLYLQQLDSIRLKYLEKLAPGPGGASAARAEYALMVGLAQLYPEITPGELRHIYKLRS